MPKKQTIPYNFGTFFITFTCHKWLPLLEIINGYDIVYTWFDHLKKNGHYINGYVIMPNHVHALISFQETGKSINIIVGNGKRFMAYEIINRLQKSGNTNLLRELSDSVENSRKANNKKHDVWELSFDWKLCESDKFIYQKLEYMHANPCKGKWNLCHYIEDYKHSSAMFYEMGKQGIYEVDDVEEQKDAVLRNVPYRRRC